MTRTGFGIYCVMAPGIDAKAVTAAVSVDWGSTAHPEGNASAMNRETAGCGANAEGFTVVTERQGLTVVTNTEGNPRDVSTLAGPDDTVGFSIVIP